MNDPFILYAIARFGDTSILLNLLRSSRQFHTLVVENDGVRYDLMDCYSKNGKINCTDGTIIKHGKIQFFYQMLQRDGTIKQQEYYTEYWRGNKIHRDGDLPAVLINGVKIWYKNGLIHRDGELPAKIYPSGYHEWWIMDEFKRGSEY